MLVEFLLDGQVGRLAHNYQEALVYVPHCAVLFILLVMLGVVCEREYEGGGVRVADRTLFYLGKGDRVIAAEDFVLSLSEKDYWFFTLQLLLIVF